MKKLASTFPNMVLSLCVITIIAGALLGWIYDLTKEPIAQQAKEQQVQAIADVAPEFNNDIEADSVGVNIGEVHYIVYPAKENGELKGAAVQGFTLNGFAGEVRVMVGFDLDGTIRNYAVLQQGETPGLGTKMVTWFRDPTGARSVIGRNPAQTSMYVTKDTEQKGEVDAITAATISSRAFLEVIRGCYAAYQTYLGDNSAAEAHDASTGASKQKHHEGDETECENSNANDCGKESAK